MPEAETVRHAVNSGGAPSDAGLPGAQLRWAGDVEVASDVLHLVVFIALQDARALCDQLPAQVVRAFVCIAHVSTSLACVFLRSTAVKGARARTGGGMPPSSTLVF